MTLDFLIYVLFFMAGFCLGRACVEFVRLWRAGRKAR